MHFSVWPNPSRPYSEVAAIATACDRAGWYACYLPDHFMPNAEDATPLRGDMLEGLTTLGALAASTTSVRLGLLVASATYRHPAVYAKALSALDHVSGGRAIAGIGAGWQENEHASYGIELGSITERIDRFEEYVEILSSMLREETTTYEGRYYTVRDAPCDPRPVQHALPLLLGVRGARRTMRIAARRAQVWNAWTSPSALAELREVLDAHCEALDRDPKSLRRSTQALMFLSNDESWLAQHRSDDPSRPVIVGTPAEVTEIVARYEQEGCDELIVPCFTLGEQSRCLETLGLFHEEVAAHFR